MCRWDNIHFISCYKLESVSFCIHYAPGVFVSWVDILFDLADRLRSLFKIEAEGHFFPDIHRVSRYTRCFQIYMVFPDIHGVSRYTRCFQIYTVSDYIAMNIFHFCHVIFFTFIVDLYHFIFMPMPIINHLYLFSVMFSFC